MFNFLSPSHNERGQILLRIIDKYLGIPLCVFFGLFRSRTRVRPPNPARIGIFILGAIGDTLLASIIITGIRKQYPTSKVILFVSSSNSSITSLLSNYNEVCVLPIKNPFISINTVRGYNFDLLIDTSQWPRISALISFFSGSKYCIGFKTTGQFRHSVYDFCVPHSNKIHEFDNFNNLLVGSGGHTEKIPSFTPLKNFNFDLFKIQKPYVIFHPWAAGYKSQLREWPTHEWIELAKLFAQKNFSIVITGGKDDIFKSNLLSKQLDAFCYNVNLAGKISLPELTGCLFDSKAIISVNTGIMHLASLLGCNVISLNGPTNVIRWGGLGYNTHNINVDKNEGGAFLNLGFEYPPNISDIMSKLSHLQVIEVFDKNF